MLEDAVEDSECKDTVLVVLQRLIYSKTVKRLMIMIFIFGVAPNVSTSMLSDIFLLLEL